MLRFLLTAALASSFAFALGQPKPGEGELHMETKVGSFKILQFNHESPARGRLEISFTGTLLVSEYKGKPIVVKGALRQEYPDAKVLPNIGTKVNKVVYHGKGTIVIDGTYNGVQWFGRDMKATWLGAGPIRFTGEFDENGNTGTYYFTDKTKRIPWPTPGQITVPPPDQKKPVLGGRGGGTKKP